MLPLEMPRIGRRASGPRDLISDVAGVTVGHCTIAEGDVQTGVTVIRPHAGDPYKDKVPGASVIINGHTKAMGLTQLDELGVFETPIALTNTLCVGAVGMAQVREAIRTNPRICRGTGSCNPLVFECSDALLSDIQQLTITDEHYLAALADCKPDFECGAVGAGRGMVNFGLKGGVGSASRIARADDREYTVGALVLSNYGKPHQLIVAGQRIGEMLQDAAERDRKPETGSIIILLATDAPLEHRQLRRLAQRATAGLSRTGSVFGHGSGDAVVAFTTSHTVRYAMEGEPTGALRPAMQYLYDTALDPEFFEAAADATEQAILKAMYSAETVIGFGGAKRLSLVDALRAVV